MEQGLRSVAFISAEGSNSLGLGIKSVQSWWRRNSVRSTCCSYCLLYEERPGASAGPVLQVSTG